MNRITNPVVSLFDMPSHKTKRNAQRILLAIKKHTSSIPEVNLMYNGGFCFEILNISYKIQITIFEKTIEWQVIFMNSFSRNHDIIAYGTDHDFKNLVPIIDLIDRYFL